MVRGRFCYGFDGSMAVWGDWSRIQTFLWHEWMRSMRVNISNIRKIDFYFLSHFFQKNGAFCLHINLNYFWVHKPSSEFGISRWRRINKLFFCRTRWRHIVCSFIFVQFFNHIGKICSFLLCWWFWCGILGTNSYRWRCNVIHKVKF